MIRVTWFWSAVVRAVAEHVYDMIAYLIAEI